MATQLVPHVGTTLLTVTSQGQQKKHRVHRVGPPSRKADLLTLGSRDTVYGYFLSVAMILCNKMDFSFGANMAGLCRASDIHINLLGLSEEHNKILDPLNSHYMKQLQTTFLPNTLRCNAGIAHLLRWVARKWSILRLICGISLITSLSLNSWSSSHDSTGRKGSCDLTTVQ